MYIGPDCLLMPVMENSHLLFFSCHLELAISENSGVFACYFHIYQAKYQLFTEITSSRWLERFCLLFSKFALYFRILDHALRKTFFAECQEQANPSEAGACKIPLLLLLFVLFLKSMEKMSFLHFLRFLESPCFNYHS